MLKEIKVPNIGDGSGEVIEINVKVGETIQEGDTIVVLESDKASMEVPSPSTGKVKKIHIKMGDQAEEGHKLISLEVQGEAASSEPAAPKATQAPEKATPSPQVSAPQADKEIKVPNIGDGSGEVIEINVKVGETIQEGDTIVVLESDKASMEVPSPSTGKVKKIHIKMGDQAEEGHKLISLEVQGEAASSEPAAPKATQAPEKATPSPQVSAPQVNVAQSASSTDRLLAGPATRKAARLMAIDLSQVKASGARGMILKEDVYQHAKQKIQTGGSGSTKPQVTLPDFSTFGSIERIQMSKMQRITAVNMEKSWLNVPHVTQFEEPLIDELEAFRKSLKEEAIKRGSKLTILPFVIKVCAALLRLHPKFNVALDMEKSEVIQKDYVNIGFAVDTPKGLLVPVIRHADKKTIWAIADEMVTLTQKALKGALTLPEMQGGCLTVSSLGSLGGTFFTPIVNSPEVAILGIGRSYKKPTYNEALGAFEPKFVLPLALSYDHRAINGADGARFMLDASRLLGDLRQLAM